MVAVHLPHGGPSKVEEQHLSVDDPVGVAEDSLGYVGPSRVIFGIDPIFFTAAAQPYSHMGEKVQDKVIMHPVSPDADVERRGSRPPAVGQSASEPADSAATLSAFRRHSMGFHKPEHHTKRLRHTLYICNDALMSLSQLTFGTGSEIAQVSLSRCLPSTISLGSGSAAFT